MSLEAVGRGTQGALTRGMNSNNGMKVGQKVHLNGFVGTVIKVLTGQLSGMVEVRLPRGVACVDSSDLKSAN